ncbi:2-amino-4-hydroxy-6-hydroxymethyldihydropteridinediphosphokinase [Thalassovita litoralis]|jgi:2-amino-4-hydroxy-6-hydroxymethyldihydropteridine diphosphokinase|uniref:2-amino-4-hydroxy-6-hydroxymethyldihydropteridine pyrophosphokinase n=1 Tax=Thalassovita litoralis TaxID=1010611 RepID=A0A521EE52_9RHOB|nr:2-amino-4-hydroxy-6-hydroxymethyldihydropteridine diphosphokinase [Thalassovita litoralis]SMO82188.1 2-amino-4-hydroxy-6-hydroxymethyldihydropteridinediphosphokinase [Thalassovita litoralis]
MTIDQEIVLALGSNQSFGAQGPGDLLRHALELLTKAGLRILRQSRFYKTPCFPAGAGPDYVNAVVTAATALPPAELLECLHRVEAELGRERQTRWAARTVDIDLIAYGQRVLPDRDTFDHWRNLPLSRQMQDAPDQLILPHPRMQDRAFVLVPMRDVAPDWFHPVLGRTVAQMCESLPKESLQEVEAI